MSIRSAVPQPQDSVDPLAGQETPQSQQAALPPVVAPGTAPPSVGMGGPAGPVGPSMAALKMAQATGAIQPGMVPGAVPAGGAAPATSPNSNPINFFGAISQAGELNGNAAFGHQHNKAVARDLARQIDQVLISQAQTCVAADLHISGQRGREIVGDYICRTPANHTDAGSHLAHRSAVHHSPPSQSGTRPDPRKSRPKRKPCRAWPG